MKFAPTRQLAQLTLCCLVGFSGITTLADVEVKPYFVRERGAVALIARLTNTGASTVKVATEGYNLEVDDKSGIDVKLNFEMPAFDHEKEKWSYVPSAQRLGIVELRKNEHAIVSVPLNKGLARKLLDPDATYSISYNVDAGFASRYGIWQGSAVIKQQSSPFKENSDVVILKDDGVNPDEQQLSFLPAVSVGGLRFGDDSPITVDPTNLPKVGDEVTVRPAPGSDLKRRVTGTFGGFAASMVTIGKRRYYILDIHPQDRHQFYDWAAYHRN